MGNDLSLYRQGLFGLGEVKTTSRQLARLELRAREQLATIEVQADLQAARVHGLAYVTKVALQGAALISEVEGQLGQLIPDARGRLQGIADIGCLGMAELVSETTRQVSR